MKSKIKIYKKKAESVVRNDCFSTVLGITVFIKNSQNLLSKLIIGQINKQTEITNLYK